MSHTRVITSRAKKLHFKLSSMQAKVKFLKSCVSEGLIPKGLRVHFNLAFNSQNDDLPKHIKSLVNENSSRILDQVYNQSIIEADQLDVAYRMESQNLLEIIGNRREWSRMTI